MKRFTKPITVTAFLLFCFLVNAQNNDTLYIQRNGKRIIKFARFKVNTGSDRKMQNDTLFLKSILHTKKEDSFHLIKVSTNKLGIMHKKFQQYYRGLKVENAEFLLHGKNGNIEVINGDFQVVNVPNIVPSLSEQRSLTIALAFVGAKEYKWEDPAMEKFVKQNTNNPNATYYPKGELVISKDYLQGSNDFKLSWRFTISSMEPSNEQLIYVDANNGNIINNVPLILDTNTSCSAQTLYSGTKTITGETYAGGIRLQESRNGVNVQTLNLQNSFNYASAIDFSNNNTNWTSGNWATFAQDQWALDAHWGEEMVLDFWGTVFSRNSIDGNGLRVLGYVHASTNWQNAQWVGGTNSNFMQYGDGYNIMKPFTALDVSGHEFGHGITQFTANLTPGTQESGALNEGFSDIWGTCVEEWAAPSKQTWLMGEEIFSSTYSCIRNLQNPKSTSTYEGQHPDTYQGTYWDNNGEPHTNSTVLSHWFYLLSQGGNGTNDNNNSYIVYGIGINVAREITYNAESSYLYSSSDYSAAKDATIQAAIDEYGSNSFEVMQVQNAWYAVGLGYQPVQLTLSGSSIVCSSGSEYTLDYLPTGATITWDKSDNIDTVSVQGSNPCVFQANDDGDYGYVRATITYNTNEYAIQKNVFVGAPKPPEYMYYDQDPLCVGTVMRFCVNEPGNPEDTYYTWYISPGDIGYINDGQGTKCIDVSAPYNTGYIQFTIASSNECGSSDYFYSNQYYIDNCYYKFSLYPNPAFDNLKIVLPEAPAEAASMELYNSQSIKIMSANLTGKETTIDISKLQKGVYYITVFSRSKGKNKVSTERFVKE